MFLLNKNFFLSKFNSRLLFWLLICLFAFSRFLYLGYSPLQYDECHNLIRAVDCINLMPDNTLALIKDDGVGFPSKLFHVLSVSIFGVSEFATRLPIVIQSLFISLFVYLIGKRFFSKKIAKMALLITLTLPFNYAYSRYAQYDIGQTFYFIIGLYFFLRYIYEDSKLGLWLSPILFALAFHSKFNSLILQFVILMAYILIGYKEKLRYYHVLLNGLLTFVFIFLFSIYQLPEFLSNLAGWVSIIIGLGAGVNETVALGISSVFFMVIWFFFIGFTILWFITVGFGIISFKRLKEIDRLFLISMILYFIIFIIQGRIQIRYLNLLSPIFALFAGSFLVKLYYNYSKKWFLIIIALLLVQYIYEYANYIVFERKTKPYRELHAKLIDIEKDASSIYLPTNFPKNYAGIFQFSTSAVKYGAFDQKRAEIYHIGHYPFPYGESAIKDYPDRLLMQDKIKDSFTFLMSGEFNKLTSMWIDFYNYEKSKKKVQGITLETFLNDPSIPTNSYYIEVLQGLPMYPSIDRMVLFNEDLSIDQSEKVKYILNITNTNSPCIIIYGK